MKYINSDKLRHLFEVWKEIEEKAGNDKGAYCYNECINAIDKMPFDDVIEIVRCKDCCWYNGTDYCSEIDFLYCNDEGAFCSRGERKETDNEI